ncbi:MAG: hypothetical protein AB2689_08480 [Candidatus Thiodiazotropha taylori]|nr:hypothetical protein [Candidatus Thiodiazotropha taylori]MCW4314837.1 hypothetical protein [Candidatus Thiodiazotropha taylori]
MADQNQMTLWDWLNSLPTPEIVFLAVFLLGSVILVGSVFSGLTIGPVAIPSIKGGWRIFGIVLGATLMAPASYSAYQPYIQGETKTQQIEETPPKKPTTGNNKKKMNGEICANRGECASGYCYPAPHPRQNGAGMSICIAADMNCALQGLDGALYGAVVSMNGTRLTCRNPGNGSAQFIR